MGADIRLMARAAVLQALWRRRDHWGPERIAAHQEKALAAARGHAVARSPFYRRLHAGLEDAPLAALPTVTKAQLMEHWDEAVTFPGLRLVDVEAHLADLLEHGGDPGRPWRGRWWMAATSGTTGQPGVFVWDRREWANAFAAYSRPNDWAGVKAGPLHRVRIAFVSSTRPTHVSAVLGATLHRVTPSVQIDATAPLADTVATLNGFAPDVLVGYPSMLRPLAAEQAAGRLRIAPRQVTSTSEVLTAQAARDIEDAWGHAPLDSYVATETAAIASTCAAGRRHLNEDLVVAESVDADNQPVPPGTAGEKLLVTVPFARTLPLIRYEMSDRLVIDGGGCPCGRAFALVTGIDGRAEETLALPGRDGKVMVHLRVFTYALDDLKATGWQVVQRRDGIDVLLEAPAPGTDTATVAARIRGALEAAGADRVDVRVVPVTGLQRIAVGKAPPVRARPDA